MSDDWRVTATFSEDGAGRVLERLREHVVERDARDRLGSHVAVSAEGDNVFLYADTRDAAREAEHIVREILAREGLPAIVKLDRWHHLAEEWEGRERAAAANRGRAAGRARASRARGDPRLAGVRARRLGGTGRARLARRRGRIRGPSQARGTRHRPRGAFRLRGSEQRGRGPRARQGHRTGSAAGREGADRARRRPAWERAGDWAFSIFGGLAG